MYLESLRLYNFRNLVDASYKFCPGTNCIFGGNGNGKTNFIEAIYFLSATRSFKTQRLRELVRWDQTECSVFGHLVKAAGRQEVGLSLEKDSRKYYCHGERIPTAAQLIGELLCVCFTPVDLQLVQGAPQERRRFLDHYLTAVRPALSSTLLDYRRVLQHKRELLRKETSPRDLQAWNRLLAEHSRLILEERLRALRELEVSAAEYYRSFCGGEGGLRLELHSDLLVKGENPSSAEIEELFSAAAVREIQQGSSLFGPHRDDIRIFLSERNSRSYASQGQARSLVLALKLAVMQLIERQRGEAPVVLLDDVDSELDAQRSRGFYELLFRSGRQIFVTGTDLVGGRDYLQGSTCYELSQGKLQPLAKG